MIADESVEAVKVVMIFRVLFQRFVQHRQGPKVDPRCGGLSHEIHHVRRMGETVDWADAEDAGVEEDLVRSLK